MVTHRLEASNTVASNYRLADFEKSRAEQSSLVAAEKWFGARHKTDWRTAGNCTVARRVLRSFAFHNSEKEHSE